MSTHPSTPGNSDRPIHDCTIEDCTFVGPGEITYETAPAPNLDPPARGLGLGILIAAFYLLWFALGVAAGYFLWG